MGKEGILLATDYHTRKTLLLKIKDTGDQEAWGEFVELYTPMVFSFLRKRGLSEDDASDVAQDVMRAVARAIENFDYDPEKGTFRSWFFTVARSKLNDFFRKQKARPMAGGGTAFMQLINEHPDPREEHEWELDYRRQMFDWAVEKVRHQFTERSWRAFWKTALDDEDPAEVAAELQLSRGAVYAAKARVIASLRERIQTVAGEWDLNVI